MKKIIKFITLVFAIIFLVLSNIIAIVFYTILTFKIPTWKLIKEINESSTYEDSLCGNFYEEIYYYTWVHKIYNYKRYKKNVSWGNINTTPRDN